MIPFCMSNFIGKPKATLRQPGFSSDFSISRKPNATLSRDRGNSLGIKSEAELPPYTVHTHVGSEVFKSVPMQRHVTIPANNRYLFFVGLKEV